MELDSLELSYVAIATDLPKKKKKVKRKELRSGARMIFSKETAAGKFGNPSVIKIRPLSF